MIFNVCLSTISERAAAPTGIERTLPGALPFERNQASREGEPVAEPIQGRPLAAEIYWVGNILRKSATESYRNSLDLGSTEWPIVATLAASGPSSLAKLCDRLSRDKGQVSRDIAALSARGMLVKERDAQDSRQIVIDVDRSDPALMKELSRITATREALLTEGLSRSEQDLLRSLLRRVSDNARSAKIFEV